MSTKPTVDPKWATDDVVDGVSGVNNVTTPSGAKQTNGFAREEFPPRQNFNWLFRHIYLWLIWLKDTIQAGSGNLGAVTNTNDRIALASKKASPAGDRTVILASEQTAAAFGGEIFVNGGLIETGKNNLIAAANGAYVQGNEAAVIASTRSAARGDRSAVIASLQATVDDDNSA
ncbi:hypothetical protein LCGC14_2583340, partial [marine sediment metagenome]